ncbi:Outer membrane protein assembly factor BamB, contains PQQ-like beta-propeller repeat [Maridesulfovibrio ferrireducens]|uniref:Outer membrane protein assembly factor BamB, contains PQQ-like beta-propeller repeat n=1 Tax=Maridesulfovibrio ferrireducens TaxID=246191 RepID=A0A1G9JK02_9BACT|nr:PQQ-binding-like beta-propeller repeat protein [Maridesulfovibrio ferrireducens]SDL37849.1 Outer membrane protein assembly factor BamB, contains PQQ-like beta-propeller repeat [Maridesulfovibrio ferrireducens]
MKLCNISNRSIKIRSSLLFVSKCTIVTCAVFLVSIMLYVSSSHAAAGDLKWSYTTVDGVISCPALGSDGTIYFGSGDKNFYALNSDGSKKWAFATDGFISSSPAIGSDGTIYFGSSDKNFYALNSDGSKKWDFITSHSVTSSPAIGSDGTIYFGSYDANLYAFNPDGSKKWEFKTNGYVGSSPIIGSDGTIYFTGENGRYVLIALNPDGSKKWEFNAGTDVSMSSAIDSDGTIYIGAADGKFYALNPDGSTKWDFAAGGAISSSPVISSDGTIYFVSNDNMLHSLDSDGNENWVFDNGARLANFLAIGCDGTIYVGSDDNSILAFNSDKTLKWSYAVAPSVPVQGGPAIDSDGTIYIGASDGKLYALEGSSGGLADSPWPKVRKNQKNTGSIDNGDTCVKSSSTQAAGVTVTLSGACAKEKTASELQSQYSLSGYDSVTTAIAFNATVSPNGSCATFYFNSTELPTASVSSLSLIKLYETKKSSATYSTYASSGPEYSVEGAWWLVDASGAHLAASDKVTKGAAYSIYFVIKDNGIYDEDSSLGNITDPVLIGSSSGGSSGCTLNPTATFSFEWSLLLLVPVLLLVRARFRL